MKKTNKQDFVGQSNTNLDEAIQRAISQGKNDAQLYKVIEIIGRHQIDKEKSYQVVLGAQED